MYCIRDCYLPPESFFFWHRCLSVSVLGICLQRPHSSLCHSVLCLCQMRVFRMLPLMHTHSFLYGLHKQTKVKCDMLSKIYSIVVVCLDATSCHSLCFWAQKHKLFTKSKNKAALKDPNPNYLQQRTLLTDLQTCNYLAYQIGVGVYCLFHSFQFCVNYWTKQMFVVCETPHECKSMSGSQPHELGAASFHFEVICEQFQHGWQTPLSFSTCWFHCARSRSISFFSETKQTHGVLWWPEIARALWMWPLITLMTIYNSNEMKNIYTCHSVHVCFKNCRYMHSTEL